MLFYNERIFKRCFSWPKKYWYRNIKEIPLYFKLMHHLIKHGYDEYATWETFDWFIRTMKSVLSDYKDSHQGVPILLDNYPWRAETDEDKKIVSENESKWNEIINKMIDLLDDMDENNPKYDDLDFKRQNEEIESAKNDFFELFSKYFFNLWD